MHFKTICYYYVTSFFSFFFLPERHKNTQNFHLEIFFSIHCFCIHHIFYCFCYFSLFVVVFVQEQYFFKLHTRLMNIKQKLSRQQQQFYLQQQKIPYGNCKQQIFCQKKTPAAIITTTITKMYLKYNMFSQKKRNKRKTKTCREIKIKTLEYLRFVITKTVLPLTEK